MILAGEYQPQQRSWSLEMCGSQPEVHLRRLQHDELENFRSGQPWQTDWKVHSAIVFPLRSYHHAKAKAAAEVLCYGYSNWRDARHG